jgi:hypothetical protein
MCGINMRLYQWVWFTCDASTGVSVLINRNHAEVAQRYKRKPWLDHVPMCTKPSNQHGIAATGAGVWLTEPTQASNDCGNAAELVKAYPSRESCPQSNQLSTVKEFIGNGNCNWNWQNLMAVPKLPLA